MTAYASAILPRESLRKALDVAKKVSDRKSTIPILSNVLLRGGAEGVELRATDLDVEVTVTVPGAADADFAVTLPAHTFADLEKKARATDQIAIDVPTGEDADASAARLDFEGLRVTMQHLPANDYPVMEWTGETHADFVMETSDFLAMISQVDFAISTEETRYYLNGVFMHAMRGNSGNGCPQLAMVATDGHRLAKTVLDCPDAASLAGVIIPRATVALLKGLCKAKDAPGSIRVKVNTTKIVFTLGNIAVMSKLVDGTFPDYGRVIPSGNDKRIAFDTAAMAEAIKAVMVVSTNKTPSVKFDFSPDEPHARLTVVDVETGTATIDCPVDADMNCPLTIGFNGAYVLDMLAHCGERAVMRLADAGSPAMVLPANDPNTEFVLMPMRV